jgi:hypothetical protein
VQAVCAQDFFFLLGSQRHEKYPIICSTANKSYAVATADCSARACETTASGLSRQNAAGLTGVPAHRLNEVID